MSKMYLNAYFITKQIKNCLSFNKIKNLRKNNYSLNLIRFYWKYVYIELLHYPWRMPK